VHGSRQAEIAKAIGHPLRAAATISGLVFGAFF